MSSVYLKFCVRDHNPMGGMGDFEMVANSIEELKAIPLMLEKIVPPGYYHHQIYEFNENGFRLIAFIDPAIGWRDMPDDTPFFRTGNQFGQFMSRLAAQ